jgi:hypothetical protein
MRCDRLVPAALLLVVGCGGAQPNGGRQAGAVERQPIEIDVAARRAGTALHIDVTGTGRGHAEREAFENPERWVVRVRAGDLDLRRVLNGPARIAREPVGHPRFGQWDVVVRFSLAFALPADATAVRVYVEAPEAAPYETTIKAL